MSRMPTLTRRGFLRWFGAGAAVTAAGVLVPEAPKIVYSFLTANPLAVAVVPSGALSLASLNAMLREVYREKLIEVCQYEPVLWNVMRAA